MLLLELIQDTYIQRISTLGQIW